MSVLPFESALRAALFSRVTADPIIQGFLGGATPALGRVAYRPKRDDIRAPFISFAESFQKADQNTPLFDITVQFDIWSLASVGHGLDEATSIARRLVALIDFLESQKEGFSPFAIPDTIGRIDYSEEQSSMDVPREDGELAVVPVVFRMLAYLY